MATDDEKLFYDAEELQLFSDAIGDELIEDMLGPNKEEDDESGIVAVLTGLEGTCKSGIAMASRSQRQIDEGYILYIIDLDNANKPLWKAHHDKDPQIRVRNPAVWEEVSIEGSKKLQINPDETLKNINKMAFGIRRLELEGVKIAGIVFDGLDTLQDDAELTMRAQNELDIEEGVQFNYWRIRNKLFRDCVAACKSLKCSKYFITHNKTYSTYKKVKNDKGKWIDVVDKTWVDGHWDKKTPDEMWQKVYCRRIDFESGRRLYVAKIDKFKGYPEYENREYLVLDIEAGIPTFYGLPMLREGPEMEEPVDFDLDDYEDEIITEDTGYDGTNR
jgi:hypothetical protein